jgi:hypothetical protein
MCLKKAIPVCPVLQQLQVRWNESEDRDEKRYLSESLNVAGIRLLRWWESESDERAMEGDVEARVKSP